MVLLLAVSTPVKRLAPRLVAAIAAAFVKGAFQGGRVVRRVVKAALVVIVEEWYCAVCSVIGIKSWLGDLRALIEEIAVSMVEFECFTFWVSNTDAFALLPDIRESDGLFSLFIYLVDIQYQCSITITSLIILLAQSALHGAAFLILLVLLDRLIAPIFKK